MKRASSFCGFWFESFICSKVLFVVSLVGDKFTANEDSLVVQARGAL